MPIRTHPPRPFAIANTARAMRHCKSVVLDSLAVGKSQAEALNSSQSTSCESVIFRRAATPPFGCLRISSTSWSACISDSERSTYYYTHVSSPGSIWLWAARRGLLYGDFRSSWAGAGPPWLRILPYHARPADVRRPGAPSPVRGSSHRTTQFGPEAKSRQRAYLNTYDADRGSARGAAPLRRPNSALRRGGAALLRPIVRRVQILRQPGLRIEIGRA